MAPVLEELNVKGCAPVNPPVKVKVPEFVEAKVFSVALSGTAAATVKGFVPDWVIAVMPEPIVAVEAREVVEVFPDAVPTFVIDPV